MKQALITGIAGFAGSHLAELLITKKIQVTGTIHPKHSSEQIGLLKNKVTLFPCDILNKKTLETLIKSNSFDYIFHLAAFSSPIQSFANPKETLENNIVGQLNLLDLLKKYKSLARILIIGSADEYGQVEEKFLPVHENTPFSPPSPYAVSKVAQDLLGYQYFLHHGLKIVRVRPFNHIGPRQSGAFVVSAFASRIAKIEKTGEGEIKVGNLTSWRDFTDVRDMVRAYLLALEKGKFGEVYNIGSGKLYKIADILDILLSFSKAKIKIKRDKKLYHDQDIQKIYCDFQKFKKDTGWQPEIPIRKTLFDTIEYERGRLTLGTQ